MTYTTIDNIPNMEVTGFSTGYSNLDEILGGRLPFGAVSLFAGEAGTGKSRLSMEIVSKAHKALGIKVLYFQLEMNPSMFKGKYLDNKGFDPKKFAVSECSDYEQMVDAMYDFKPDVVVVDSVNMLDGSSNHHAVKRIMMAFNDAAHKLNCHILLIGQLGKDGKVKGSTDWVFLPDIVCHLTSVKLDTKVVDKIFKSINAPKDFVERKKAEFMKGIGSEIESRFLVSIPNKNRYGRAGGIVTMQHFNEGIKQVIGQASFDDSFSDGVPYPIVRYVKANSKPVTEGHRTYKPEQLSLWGQFKEFCMSLKV